MQPETPNPLPDIRKSYLTESIIDLLMNSKTYFSLNKRLYPKITADFPKTYILGHQFSVVNVHDPKELEKVNKDIENFIDKILWFSYRKNFPILKPTNQKTFISDTGWGCSIRVGQMLFAETLKRHMRDYLNLDISDEKIVELFDDMEQFPLKSPFSIQQIARTSAEMFNIMPGSWYRFTHVFMIFEQIYKDFAQENIPKLECLLFSDGILFFNQIYEKNTQYSKCLSCQKVSKEPFFDANLCAECKKFNKALLILICLMPGPTTLRPEALPFINSLMSSRFFVGLMGGKPGKAKYFIALDHERLVAKDPHFVQDSQAKDIGSYYTKELKYVEIRKMASSLAFGFYFKDERDWKEFECFIREEKENLEDKWLLAFEEEYKEIDVDKDVVDLEEEKMEIVEEENMVVVGFKEKFEIKSKFF